MEIKLHEISVKDIVEGYERDEESGQILAYKGKLNVRPKYQRNFIYTGEQRDEVIRTILKEFPLNSIYWVKNADGFEVLDGQQRTISICDYVKGRYSVDECFFSNLTDDKQNIILNYKLFVYICEGTDSEKLGWFKTINIAGETLTDQELRNAIYASEWLSDAKWRFSKRDSLAEQKGGAYLNCKAIRQEILEKAIAWMVNCSVSSGDKKICEYMAKHAVSDKNADELWFYFSAVIEWIEAKFPNYRKEMKGLEWGLFYNRYKDKALNAKELEAEIARLMMDDEVTSKKGIYEYLLSENEKCLNLRAFSESQKGQIYEKQKGVCANALGIAKGLKGVKCKSGEQKLDLKEMHADHILPWSKGGKTELSNCQMLCASCNLAKSNKI